MEEDTEPLERDPQLPEPADSPTCPFDAASRNPLFPLSGIGFTRETQSIAFLSVPGSE
jgi:hypothetical protein